MGDGTRLIEATAVGHFREHALCEYPNECLGYVDARGAYHSLLNAAPDPQKHALADRHVLRQLLIAGQLRALCHSHPGGPDCPSEADGGAQIELEVPFIITSTNGQATTQPFAFGDQLRDDAPLVGRGFRHYVNDCYDLIRVAWWRDRGELLPQYPRNWEWWLEDTPGGKDLYRRFFADAGFYRIDASEVRPGDAWLASIRSEVPNHAGLFLDGGLALHHPSSGLPHDPQRLSKRESIARWAPWITHWLRRD